MSKRIHVSPPEPLNPADPRLQGPSREALVRALQRTAALLTDYDAAHRMLREEDAR